jgi:hypothetical protein
MYGEADTMSRSRVELLEAVVRSCSVDYDDENRTFAQLDTKAQNAAAMANIFLAVALFMLPGKGSLMSAPSQTSLVPILSVGIGFLVCALISAALALWLRRTASPLGGGVLLLMTDELTLAYPEGLPERALENFLRDQARAWIGSRDQVAAKNKTKARWVEAAQLFLLAAMLMLSAALLKAIAS